MTGPVLSIKGLSVSYAAIPILNAVDIEAWPGEVIGIAGESGCGKSTLALAAMGLLSPAAHVTAGEIFFRGNDIAKLDAKSRRALRGRDMAMVFQDPMSAFNPVLTIGDQLSDYQHHLATPKTQRLQRAAEMLAKVGIADAAQRLSAFPHELSGGMRQRVGIAATLLMNPSLLIADEPTTALDVTLEAQIINLLRELRHTINGAIIIITHHLGVIAQLCDRVYVMYAGEVVETAPVDALFHAPRHPYTRALLACDPARLHNRADLLPAIPGELPSRFAPGAGCLFRRRCAGAIDQCGQPQHPVQVGDKASARCCRVAP